MTIEELLAALELGEDQDIEFKAAQGGLPKSIWESVSAFANTEGGTIVLGVKECDGGFEIVGIRRTQPLLKDFWDTHNNPQKLNYPVCRDADVTTLTIEDRTLICIQIPQVSRQQRPIYINGNPMGGTFKRNFEGDYRISDADIRQMLRDAGDDPIDGRILEGFTLEDLDAESLMAYRNRFASRSPDHPFLAKSDRDLLESLGGWRHDRISKIEGITLAGILMFGKERSLLDALPHFQLDYQEQLSNDPEVRWTYRLTVDGKWAPNLFNFYYRVYPRLVENIDVPFKLDKNATRLEETHVHEALREVLVNTLIHADHQTTRAISIVNRQDVFVFINPGRLRIPRSQLYQGGISDPRNPNLLKMFQLIGLVERAGSGFQKILRAWREQHWIMPLVAENLILDLTGTQLPVVSMIPEDVEQELRLAVGDAYQTLDELGRTILILAHRFGEIANKDIQHYRSEHPTDIGIRLRQFVSVGWLEKSGQGSGTRYKWLTIAPDSSEHSPDSSEHLDTEQEAKLLEIAAVVRNTNQRSKVLMESTILALCKDNWLNLRTLARLLDRQPDTLRNHYTNRMLKDGRLEAKFPGKPHHPGQAYRKKDTN